MDRFYTPDSDLPPVRVVAFSGARATHRSASGAPSPRSSARRSSSPDYYAPLAAPGQTAWVNLLEGDPLLILLDELPPYFVNAASRSIGNSDLSVVTTTALANLLNALGRVELRNVCLVISDLKATYGAGGAQIVAALQDMEAEDGPGRDEPRARAHEYDELYHILRQRIFEKQPDVEEVDKVAAAYARAIREAKQMDVTNISPEQFAARVKESYPFHPAIRNLYARFRDNQAFNRHAD